MSFNSDNGILGLTFLKEYTKPILNPEKLQEFEWRRKIISKSGGSKFRLKYYGDLHDTFNSLIVATDFAPQKLIAIDVETEEEILIFDGCKHGYNAMFCDEYSKEQIENRLVNKFYKDAFGNEVFELIISTYYGFDYEEDMREDVDGNNQIKPMNEGKIDFEIAKRNGCDSIYLIGINQDGKEIEILSEELA